MFYTTSVDSFEQKTRKVLSYSFLTNLLSLAVSHRHQHNADGDMNVISNHDGIGYSELNFLKIDIVKVKNV